MPACRLLLALLLAAGSRLLFAADFAGQWEYRQHERPHVRTVEFSLWQSGNRVYGTWSEEALRSWGGCLRGMAEGSSLLAEFCHGEDTYGRGVGPDCPSFAPAHEKLELQGKALVWSRYDEGSRKWTKHVTLRRIGAQPRGKLPGECESLR